MSKASVLVVEDERIVARDIQLILERSGYHVPAIAVSGVQAIAHAIQYQPDLVLMDIVLQGDMDGIQAANQINQRYDIPIIYLTAYGDNAMVNRSKASEPIAYITKPYEEHNLLMSLEIALNQFRRSQRRTDETLRRSEELWRTVFAAASDAILLMDEEFNLIRCNTAAQRVYGYTESELLTLTMHDIHVPEGTVPVKLQLHVPVSTRDDLWETRHRRKDGTIFPVEVSTESFEISTGRRYVHIVRDITVRKREEEALRTSERRSLAALNALTSHIALLNEFGEIITVNQAWRDYAHANAPRPAPTFEGANYLTICDKVPVDSHDKATAQAVAAGIRAVIRGEITRFHLDYGYLCSLSTEQRWFDVRVTRFTGDGPVYVTVAHEDISARKQADLVLLDNKEQIRLQKERAEALAEISLALSETLNDDEALDLVANRVSTLIGDLCIVMMLSNDGQHLDAAAIHNCDPDVTHFVRGVLLSKRYHLGEGLAGYVAQTGEAILIPEALPEDIRAMSNPVIHAELDHVNIYGALFMPLISEGKILGVLGITRNRPGCPYTLDDQTFMQDIAHRAAQTITNARLYRDAQRHAKNLEALHAIDAAITSSFDLRAILNVVVSQTIAQLGVDAAAVLLLNPDTHTLSYAAGYGFRGKAIERECVRLGVGYAGRAALERHVISINSVDETNSDFADAAVLVGENIVCCHAAPLIAKGHVNGVLEVFVRTHHDRDDEWVGFLETLAQQAAIAVDSAQLFENLQRSNLELFLAYDATIEGWSRAMDMRDRETEGHTQRVTELTERMARATGMSESVIVHMRRGALLHDMGKMGVPDNILLKPGKLTEEEWVIMRQHPQYAYDMLAPISYLRPALDIPYYHHERWDGMGYPHGLKGEQIPLAARLFAVADVWDALRSNRPYRLGWPEDKVQAHIRTLAGTHFDPKAVEVFFQVMDETASLLGRQIGVIRQETEQASANGLYHTTERRKS